MMTQLPLIRVTGEAYERGLIHGANAKSQVSIAVETYFRSYRHAGLSDDQVRTAAQRFVPTLERDFPDLTAELRGIAEGSGWDFSAIIALNARNELLHEAQPACTAVAVLPEATSSGHTLLGQNLDWNTQATPSAVVLAIDQTYTKMPTILSVTEAGTLSRSGLNSAGFGLCINFLSGREATSKVPRNLIPTQTLRRVVLDSRTFSQAVGALYRYDAMIASNYLIAHRDGWAIDLEIAPEGVGVVHPQDGLLVHTNHFLSPWAHTLDPGIPELPDTLWRLDRMRTRMLGCRGRIDVETLQSALRDHTNYPDSICRHGDHTNPNPAQQMETSVSVVMDLTESRMWLTAGPPCKSAYSEVTADFELKERGPES